MSTHEPVRRLWTVVEYHRAAEAGIFAPHERLELIDGEILRMSPQNPLHSAVSGLAEAALQAVFRRGYVVRIQKPLTLGTVVEPEPDIAVVRGALRDYVHRHPVTA